jgi:HEAT repeat protein
MQRQLGRFCVSGWVAFAIFFVLVAGCGDSRSRRKSAAAELRHFATDFRANPADLSKLDAIIDVLDHGKYSFDRTYACGELQRLGAIAKPAVPALVRALDCGDGFVEREAPRALGSMGEEARDAVPALIANLKIAKGDAAWFTAEALGNIGEPALIAIPELEIAAVSNDALLADSANEALKRLRDIQKNRDKGTF